MRDLTFTQITERLNNFDLPHFDLVIGIADGGLIPAGMIAYRLRTELSIIKISFRDDKNLPLYNQPVILSAADKIINKKILIVDDVSVTGKTLEKAKQMFEGNDIQTLTFKGKADYVLFPEISQCINWPWKFHSGKQV